MIKIEHLTKEYASGRTAIDDISFDVKPGEVFGFLGPNGAGKTTTIKILTTLLRPTSGSAVVSGHNVIEAPFAVRMSFGYVGQQSGVDPALTVGENLTLQGRLYHLAPSLIQERISFLLGLFDLQGMADQWVGALSGGMKRKLDIATALIHQPNLLFLDEPTLGLDPKSRADLWTYLRRINREQGVTLFLTTHYLEEVDQLAHRVAIIDQGRIQAIGTPDQLKESLGADCIHLSFKQPPSEALLSFFRQKEPVKEVIQQGDQLRLYLYKGKELLPKVLQWVEEQGISAETVVLTRPSLDDVFLKYTGKSLIVANTKEEESSSWGWGKKWGGKSDGGGWGEKWKNKEATGQEGASQAKEGRQEWKHDGASEAPETAAQKEWPQKEWPQKNWKDQEWPNK